MEYAEKARSGRTKRKKRTFAHNVRIDGIYLSDRNVRETKNALFHFAAAFFARRSFAAPLPSVGLANSIYAFYYMIEGRWTDSGDRNAIWPLLSSAETCLINTFFRRPLAFGWNNVFSAIADCNHR